MDVAGRCALSGADRYVLVLHEGSTASTRQVEEETCRAIWGSQMSSNLLAQSCTTCKFFHNTFVVHLYYNQKLVLSFAFGDTCRLNLWTIGKAAKPGPARTITIWSTYDKLF